MPNWLRKEVLTSGGLVLLAASSLGFAAGILPAWSSSVGWVAVGAGSIMYLLGK